MPKSRLCHGAWIPELSTCPGDTGYFTPTVLWAPLPTSVPPAIEGQPLSPSSLSHRGTWGCVPTDTLVSPALWAGSSPASSCSFWLLLLSRLFLTEASLASQAALVHALSPSLPSCPPFPHVHLNTNEAPAQISALTSHHIHTCYPTVLPRVLSHLKSHMVTHVLPRPSRVSSAAWNASLEADL